MPDRYTYPGSDVLINKYGITAAAFLLLSLNAAFIPRLILVQAMPDDQSILEEWLAERRGGKAELRVPLRGPKRSLMETAEKNAAEYLRLQQAEWTADTNRQTEALTDLQQALRLERPPTRIECFDVSTLQGTNTVGSMK